MLPRRMMVERITGAAEADIVGKRDRQVFLRHWHGAAAVAMNDGNRTAPVALPRGTPVTQAEIDLALRLRLGAEQRRLQPLRNLILRLRHRHAVEEARIDHSPV